MVKNSSFTNTGGWKIYIRTILLLKLFKTQNSRLLTWFIDVGDMVTRLHSPHDLVLTRNLKTISKIIGSSWKESLGTVLLPIQEGGNYTDHTVRLLKTISKPKILGYWPGSLMWTWLSTTPGMRTRSPTSSTLKQEHWNNFAPQRCASSTTPERTWRWAECAVPECGMSMLYLKMGWVCCTWRWAECAVPEDGLSVLYLKMG